MSEKGCLLPTVSERVFCAWLPHISNSSFTPECWPETSSWKPVSVNLLRPPFPLNSARAADTQAVQDLTPGLQQPGSPQQQGCFSCAQHSLHGILVKMQVLISHPLVVRSLWHTVHFAQLTSVTGHTTQVSFFHCVCRWLSIHEGNTWPTATSPNKNKSQQLFHLN